MVVSQPNSEGMKREMPAEMEASMRVGCRERAVEPRFETRASCPLRADVRDVGEV